MSPEKPVAIPVGGTAQLRLRLPLRFAIQAANRLHLALNAAPEGITLDDVLTSADAITFRLRSEAGKIKPGLRGNLIVDVSLDMPARSSDGKTQDKMRPVPMGVLPAIPFEITK